MYMYMYLNQSDQWTLEKTRPETMIKRLFLAQI